MRDRKKKELKPEADKKRADRQSQAEYIEIEA
jgi:hypothetical protein